MFRIAASAAAVAALCLTACASAPPTEEPSIAPLQNFYDVAWVRSADNSIATLEQVADELSEFDVVFFGESHAHPGNHLAQMSLFQALHERSPDMSLSLEQFERDTQPVIDQYLAGEIGEKALEKAARAWPNYKSSYRPLVEYAASHELPVIAANAPKNIVICVGKKGPEILDEIPQPDRSWVAEVLHLEEGAYFDKYMALMGDGSTHGGGGKHSDDVEEPADGAVAGDSEEKASNAPGLSPAIRAMVMRSFAAQVTRDDTMAESIAKHLRDHPERKVLHLDGHFHSESYLGIVERLKIRMPELKLAVINPVEVADSAAPAWTEKDLTTGDYLLLMHELPDAFVKEENELEFQRELMGKRSGNTCEYAEDTTGE